MENTTVRGWLSKRRDQASYAVAERVARAIHHEAILSDRAKAWLEDTAFRQAYTKFEPSNFRRMDRVWTVAQLAGSVVALDIPGATAECGAYQGLTSFVICQQTAGTRRAHHVFDSFEGLSAPGAEDGDNWRRGDLSTPESLCRRNLAEFDFVHVHPGWIPQTFGDVAESRFCLVHIDVDLYQPTWDSLAYFYDKVTPGGVLICDDYGSTACPGASQAMDEFFADRRESILHLPTGQGIVWKSG